MSEIQASRSLRFTCLLPAFIRCRLLIRQDCGYFCYDVVLFVFAFEINGENISYAKQWTAKWMLCGEKHSRYWRLATGTFIVLQKLRSTYLQKLFRRSIRWPKCHVQSGLLSKGTFKLQDIQKNRFLKAYDKQTRPKYYAVVCQSCCNRG